jgi:hypothetical protein
MSVVDPSYLRFCADLERLGIGTVVDLPGVGRNLQDHTNNVFLNPISVLAATAGIK